MGMVENVLDVQVLLSDTFVTVGMIGEFTQLRSGDVDFGSCEQLQSTSGTRPHNSHFPEGVDAFG
jgi:hypothetical protein